MVVGRSAGRYVWRWKFEITLGDVQSRSVGEWSGAMP